MQNLFKPPNIRNDTDNSQQVNVSHINAENYTNYFIIPNSNDDGSNTKSAREKIPSSTKANAKNPFTTIKAKDTPIKLAFNHDLDKIMQGNGHHLSAGKKNLIDRDNDLTVIKPRNNMFLNYTKDIVPKKQNNMKSKYNSFDCRVKEHSMNEVDCKMKDYEFQRIIDDIGQVFNYEVHINHLPARVKRSYIKAIEVDELIQELLPLYKKRFSVKNKIDYNNIGNWVHNANIRHELYAQEIELYRALCEELIRRTDITKLKGISDYAYSIMNNGVDENLDDNQRANFIRSVNAMIRNKYIASERIDNMHNNNTKLKSRKERAHKY